MKFTLKRLLVFVLSITTVGFTTACASGGFKLTRKYAGFVNKQPLIIRIILYILTGIVFAITLLADAVLFNTMDFWEGRVSQGTYEFKDGERTFVVHHRLVPGSNLRETKIEVRENSVQLARVIELRERANQSIDVTIDGERIAEVANIQSLPLVRHFDLDGRVVRQHDLNPYVLAGR